MSHKLKILLDLDGVICNFNFAACKLANYELTQENKNWLMEDRNRSPEDNLKKRDKSISFYKLIDKAGIGFWENLELFPWAHYLVETCLSFDRAQLAFCSSYGPWACGATGKVLFKNRHFPKIPLILTREKELCAHSNSMLIDDYPKKIEKFRNAGGAFFLWPNQYLLEDRVDLRGGAILDLSLVIRAFLD